MAPRCLKSWFHSSQCGLGLSSTWVCCPISGTMHSDCVVFPYSLRMLQAPFGFLYFASHYFRWPNICPDSSYSFLETLYKYQFSSATVVLAVTTATVVPFTILYLPLSAVTTLGSCVWFIFATLIVRWWTESRTLFGVIKWVIKKL